MWIKASMARVNDGDALDLALDDTAGATRCMSLLYIQASQAPSHSSVSGKNNVALILDPDACKLC